ncbi:unnamed protein product [Toxocara canis]|uniref:Transposase n=1 Tax=Toxocara canis TaxID=6265 RepID=A0A183UXE7_TOXCA|nr:unnamed protein product [Toxocara canis]
MWAKVQVDKAGDGRQGKGRQAFATSEKLISACDHHLPIAARRRGCGLVLAAVLGAMRAAHNDDRRPGGLVPRLPHRSERH